jgi:hypothetical protein
MYGTISTVSLQITMDLMCNYVFRGQLCALSAEFEELNYFFCHKEGAKLCSIRMILSLHCTAGCNDFRGTNKNV